MRRSFCTFIIVILAPAGIIFFNSCKSVEINAPDMIVIDKGGKILRRRLCKNKRRKERGI